MYKFSFDSLLHRTLLFSWQQIECVNGPFLWQIVAKDVIGSTPPDMSIHKFSRSFSSSFRSGWDRGRIREAFGRERGRIEAEATRIRGWNDKVRPIYACKRIKLEMWTKSGNENLSVSGLKIFKMIFLNCMNEFLFGMCKRDPSLKHRVFQSWISFSSPFFCSRDFSSCILYWHWPLRETVFSHSAAFFWENLLRVSFYFFPRIFTPYEAKSLVALLHSKDPAILEKALVTISNSAAFTINQVWREQDMEEVSLRSGMNFKRSGNARNCHLCT